MKVIRRFFAIIALIVTTPNLQAQPYWDISTGVGVGNNIAGRISLDFVLENQLSLSGFFQGHIEKSGLFSDKVESVFAGGMVGYAPTLGGICRLNLRGGVGYYSVQMTEHNWFGANDTMVSSSSIGLIVAPRFEFLLSRVFGLGFGGYAVFAREKSLYGISLDLMLGELRD